MESTREHRRLKWILDTRPRSAPQLIKITPMSSAMALTQGATHISLFSLGTRVAIAALVEGWPAEADTPRVTHISVLSVAHMSRATDSHIEEFNRWLHLQHKDAIITHDQVASLVELEAQADHYHVMR